MMTRRRWLIALILIAALGSTGSVHAYTILTLDGGRTSVRWPTPVMTYEVHDELVPYLEGDVEGIRQIMQAWQNVECASISLVDNGDTGSEGAAYPYGGFDGVNRVVFVEGQNWRPEDSQALAITALSYGAGGGKRIAEADIAFNGNYQWTISGGSGQNFLSTALHEAGHYFGIQHSSSASSIMYFQENGLPPILTPDDQEALCFLYPADIGGHTCGDDDDCPLVEGSDQLGQTITLGKMRCVDSLCQLGDDPIKRGFGEPCADSTQCEDELFCEASGAQQICTRGCLLANNDCPVSFQCVPEALAAESGLCWPEGAGDTPLGEPCDYSSQCEGGLCVADPRPDVDGGLCTEFCQGNLNDCPDETLCVPIALPGRSACLPTGDGVAGTACSSFMDCEGGRCISDPQATLCRAECDADSMDSTCEVGTECLRTVYGDACLSSGEGELGATCTGSFDCSSLLCLETLGGEELCSQRCDESHPCGDGFDCQFFGVGQEFCTPAVTVADEGEDTHASDMTSTTDTQTTTGDDTRVTSTADVTEPAAKGEDEGCGCRSVQRSSRGPGSGGGALALFVVGLLLLRRRRR